MSVLHFVLVDSEIADLLPAILSRPESETAPLLGGCLDLVHKDKVANVVMRRVDKRSLVQYLENL